MPLAIGCALAALSISCAQANDADAPIAQKSEALSLKDVHRELGLGDHGRDVEAVYSHLREYGYFPNPTLAKRYPNWVPVVPDAAKDQRTFGPELEEAVSQAQGYLGLPATGRVDASTLLQLQADRCGVPENGSVSLDPTDKWSPQITDANGNPARWNKATITYKITDFGSFVPATANAVLDASLATWNAASFLTMSRTTSNTFDVEIKFWPRGTPPAANTWTIGGTLIDFGDPTNAGASFPPPSSMTAPYQRIGINTTVMNSGGDLQSTLTHEIGHTLGLGHSSVFNGDWGIMAPSLAIGSKRTLLQQDDRQALSLLYNVWDSKNGTAVDIGVGGSASAPKVYAIGAGANTIWFYKNSTWSPVPGNGAAIAVDDAGYAWVVSSNGSIWRGNGTDPTAFGFGWIAKSFGSAANDIAASGGQVWIISRTAAFGSSGDFVVQQLTGNGCTGSGVFGCLWSSANGGVAKRIAVDWLGRPWVTQSNGTVWRYTIGSDGLNVIRQSSGTPTWHGLTQLNPPAQGQPACATDIAAGSDHSVWVVGCNAIGNDFTLWIWDEQDGSNVMSTVTAEGEFRLLDGFASRISASPNGRAWVLQAAGNIFIRSPHTNTPAP
jgi:hypothetical protein